MTLLLLLAIVAAIWLLDIAHDTLRRYRERRVADRHQHALDRLAAITHAIPASTRPLEPDELYDLPHARRHAARAPRSWLRHTSRPGHAGGHRARRRREPSMSATRGSRRVTDITGIG